MTRSQRPGGLTALGFIHIFMFVCYALNVGFSVIGLFTNRALLLNVYGSVPRFSAVMFGSGLVAMALIVNGIGLLKLSRVLGLFASLLLMVFVIADAALTLSMVPRAFSVMSIAGLAYALMTAGLVWTVFRRDFDHIEGSDS